MPRTGIRIRHGRGFMGIRRSGVNRLVDLLKPSSSKSVPVLDRLDFLEHRMSNEFISEVHVQDNLTFLLENLQCFLPCAYFSAFGQVSQFHREKQG